MAIAGAFSSLSIDFDIMVYKRHLRTKIMCALFLIWTIIQLPFQFIHSKLIIYI